MSLITRCQRQTLCYWAPLTSNQYGEPRWEPPVEMACRWDDKSMQIQAADGTMVLSRVEIISAAPLVVGGVVILGELSGVSYWVDAKANLGAYEILKTAITPNIRNTESLYEAWA